MDMKIQQQNGATSSQAELPQLLVKLSCLQSEQQTEKFIFGSATGPTKHIITCAGVFPFCRVEANNPLITRSLPAPNPLLTRS